MFEVVVTHITLFAGLSGFLSLLLGALRNNRLMAYICAASCAAGLVGLITLVSASA